MRNRLDDIIHDLQCEQLGYCKECHAKLKEGTCPNCDEEKS